MCWQNLVGSECNWGIYKQKDGDGERGKMRRNKSTKSFVLDSSFDSLFRRVYLCTFTMCFCSGIEFLFGSSCDIAMHTGFSYISKQFCLLFLLLSYTVCPILKSLLQNIHIYTWCITQAQTHNKSKQTKIRQWQVKQVNGTWQWHSVHAQSYK